MINTTMLYSTTSFIHQILVEYSVSQIVSAAAMLGILWYFYANDGPLLAKARDIQGLGVLVLLPLGVKLIFLYLIICYVCAIYYTTSSSQTVGKGHGISTKIPGTSDARPIKRRNSPLLHQTTIQLPVEGWSIGVEFSLNSPHVKFLNYEFDFAKGLDKSLAKSNRSGEVLVEFTVDSPAIVWPTDVHLKSQDKPEGWDARLKIIHKEHRAISVYEFALTYACIRLSLKEIPPQLRKGGAGGQAWLIDAPNFTDFQNFIREALAPKRSIEDIPIGFFHTVAGRRQFNNYISNVDLAQADIPIIVPSLKAISFGSNSQYGGVFDGPFHGRSRKIPVATLVYISLNAVSIFAEEYRAILVACPELRTLIIHRPGESYGIPQLDNPTGLVISRLQYLHLIDCRVDVRNFLLAPVVYFPAITELVFLCSNNQTIQANELGIEWTGLRSLQISNILGEDFIQSCKMNLPVDSTLETI
ncbi:hypothetical protein J3R30DRAFT_121130 [Lentinula aciculospora]|uniref:Uncharacterized protein n=1 Tax=Lentinula aciculospora TaxID=153920 RepID=A0A9W9AWA2_9AGAR|nr:hypothetical protein J3R30DRAFT_121130 [Lentinula aciculospora]